MRIFLVRHGESLGNIDETAYARLQDHNVPLTQWGYEQAVDAGKFIQDYYKSRPELADKKPRVWYSPFKRTVQTKDGFLHGLGTMPIGSVWEDYLLREQDFGLFSDISNLEEQRKKFPLESAKYSMARETKGKFYARPPMGECRADVALRVRQFQETLMRDAAQGHGDAIIISHGVTARAFEMDFLHRGVEWFENSPNPGNCDITLIEGDAERGYTAKRIYSGKERPKNLPADHKTQPHEGGRAIA